MAETQTADPIVELATLQRELVTVKGQLSQAQAELGKLRLGHELAGHLTKHVQADAALETARALAERVERSGNGRCRLEHAGGVLWAESPAELCELYLQTAGSYLLQTAALSRPGDGTPAPATFDQARIGDAAYAKKWKETDPAGFKVAWKRHLAEVAARPIK